MAVEVGLLLAVVLFAKQMGSSMQIEEIEPEGAEIAPHLHEKLVFLQFVVRFSLAQHRFFNKIL